ncbi:hypothetical protein LCGC14_1063540 [marine sediment metagenome]|uniref:Uncharacterized protein n=1 Tax=marine sediment metagenome TaxID=412755 RepID=A0A0F9MKH8_9ZZZZ
MGLNTRKKRNKKLDKKKNLRVNQIKLSVNFTWIKENIYLLDQSNYKSINQFIWHLNLLIKFGYIKKIKVGGKYTIFISHNLDEKFGRIWFLLRDD